MRRVVTRNHLGGQSDKLNQSMRRNGSDPTDWGGRESARSREVGHDCVGSREKRLVPSWIPDWSWGLPFLVLTVVAHVSAILWTAKMLVTHRRMAAKKASHFVIFVAFAALASAVYLAIEAAAWAGLYLWLGALPAWAPAMLYSLEAITSFGHAQIYLADRWQLLGAIEAVNGLILFGLTTAFLFAAIQQVWLLWRD
jgi:hypothetical protein